MRAFRDESYNIRTELDEKHCQLQPDQLERMSVALHPLNELVKPFPVSDLYVTVTRHHRSSDFHVTAALRVPSRTLFTGDRQVDPEAAFDRCIRKLVSKVRSHKDNLESTPEHRRASTGHEHDILPDVEPDLAETEEAVRDGDYIKFREMLVGYDVPVRLRVGRWIQRYPALEEQVGDRITIEDVTEEVFLNAFEQFPDRPRKLRFGQWLENLIDESLKALLEDPEAELENVRFARTWRAANGG